MQQSMAGSADWSYSPEMGSSARTLPAFEGLHDRNATRQRPPVAARARTGPLPAGLFVLAGLLQSSEPSALQGKRGEKAAAPTEQAGQVEKVDALGLTLTIPLEITQLQALAPEEPSSQRKAGWSGTLGTQQLWIYVYGMPREEFGYVEPDDVCEGIRDHLRQSQDPEFRFEQSEFVRGPFGHASYAALGYGPMHEREKKSVSGTFFVLAGLAEDHGYAIEVESRPALEAPSTAVVLDFLRKGVSCSAKPRDPRWTNEEVEARWLKDAPPALAKKREKPVRTKHYVFLSNTDAAKQMGSTMEKFYSRIQELYPFPEVEGRRLMPVFLFRNPEEYYEFFAAAFQRPLEEAQKSKGVAWSDFYATYYDAPQDPVHIHEATHQIFANRLHLGGGGSWFQEGVAEYASTSASDRTDASNLVKKGRHRKLVEFVTVESLLFSATDEDKRSDDRASSGYSQAALLIEFVMESKWSKPKFQDWLHALGKCPSNDLAAIEQATQKTLGVDLAGFEQKWVEYCKDR